MGISIDHKSWKKDHSRWLATNRKFLMDQKKLSRAVENLEKYLKQHAIELKLTLKKAVTEKKMLTNKSHSPSLHKSLKKAHSKRNRYYASQDKSRKNLQKLTRTIESTVKSL